MPTNSRRLKWIIMIRYQKNDLRLNLERNMGQTVTPLEFAKWLSWYCERTNQPDDLIKAKTLTAEQADAFADWLGYPLR